MAVSFFVKLIGDFGIIINDQLITIENNKPTNANLMLQYLFFNYASGVSKETLIKSFYDGDDIVNPENNLKVNMHRLRRLLKEATDLDLDFIKIKKSVYFINPEISVSIDYLEFQKEFELAKKESSVALKITHLEKALSFYDNELLPHLSTLPDVAYANVQLKKLYFEALFELITLRGVSSYQENISLMNKAITIYPYDDELYVAKLRLMIEAKDYKEATAFYTATNSFFLENMGMNEIPSLKEEYKKMSENISNLISDIVDVRETIQEDSETRHAYFCNYLSFIDNYNIVNRLMTRLGKSVYLLLCTIHEDDIERLNDLNKNVHRAIEMTLRSGDIFTSYNANQFLVLLCNLQQENISLCTGRITEYLKKNTKVDLNKITFTFISTLESLK